MVNTFLPYKDYYTCAKVLDYQRLNAQRREAMVIHNVIEAKHFIKDTLHVDYSQAAQGYKQASMYVYRVSFLDNIGYVYNKYVWLADEYTHIDFSHLKRNSEDNLLKYALVNKRLGYGEHPITHRWSNDLGKLRFYINVMINEWISRGYNNSMKYLRDFDICPPTWLTDDMTQEYQKILLHKKPEHYQLYFS